MKLKKMASVISIIFVVVLLLLGATTVLAAENRENITFTDGKVRHQVGYGRAFNYTFEQYNTINISNNLCEGLEFCWNLNYTFHTNLPFFPDRIKLVFNESRIEKSGINIEYTYVQERWNLHIFFNDSSLEMVNKTWRNSNVSVTEEVNAHSPTATYRSYKNSSYPIWNNDSCTLLHDGDCIDGIHRTQVETGWEMQSREFSSTMNYPLRRNDLNLRAWAIVPEDTQTKLNVTYNIGRSNEISSVTDPFIISGNFTSCINGVNCNRTEYNTTSTPSFIQINASDFIQELPNNQYNESAEWRDYGIDMTGNVLLFHFNNESGLENNSRVHDFSKNNNNGTWFNGFSNTTGKLGVFGGFFDGINNYVNVSSSPTVNNLNSGNVTYSLWFYATGFGQAGGGRFFSKNTDNNGQTHFSSIEVSTTNIQNRVYNSVGTEFLTESSIGTVSLNRWTHLVIRFNNLGDRNTSIFLDGVEVNYKQRGPLTGTVDTDANTPLRIGDQNDVRQFNGTMDEFAIWNRSLSSTEILNIYNRQKDAFIQQGEYQSEIFDAGSSANWTNLSWTTEVCYQCELPNDRTNEDSFNFKKPANMTDNLLLFHYNQSGTENSTFFQDYSGKGNNGTCIDCPKYNTSSKFGAGYTFDGINDVINITDKGILDFPNGTAFTFATWIFPNQIMSGKNYVIYAKDDGGNNGNPLLIFLGTGTWRITYDSTVINPIYDANLPVGANTSKTWHHLAMMYQFGLPSSAKIFWDGQLLSGSWTNGVGTETVVQNNFASAIGARVQTSSLYLNATLDETAIWNRTLNETYVQELYKRGVLRLNLTVRSCDNSACAGEAYTDVVNDTSKQILLPVIANRYFQYKQMLTTDDGGFSPQVYNTTVEYIGEQINPNVTNILPLINSRINFSSLKVEISSNITDNGFLQNISFNVSYPNGSTLLYYPENSSRFSNYTLNFSIPRLLGIYNVTVIVNDTIGNFNNTQFTNWTIIDDEVPNVTALVPVSGASFSGVSSVEVSCNITDGFFVSYGIANVTSPSGSVTQYVLTNTTFSKWNVTVTTSTVGTYTVVFVANDTSNNYNRTETTSFIVTAVATEEETLNGLTGGVVAAVVSSVTEKIAEILGTDVNTVDSTIKTKRHLIIIILTSWLFLLLIVAAVLNYVRNKAQMTNPHTKLIVNIGLYLFLFLLFISVIGVSAFVWYYFTDLFTNIKI